MVYAVSISNAYGTVTSSNATLTVITAPTVSTQPSSQTVTAGQTASFSVTASGTAPFTYQWRKNGSNIVGATSSTYTTPVTSSADHGAVYSVVVGNNAGTVHQQQRHAYCCSCTHCHPACQPNSQCWPDCQLWRSCNRVLGHSATNGQRTASNISGATSSSYTTPATSSADNGAVYAVSISNAYGTVSSNNATLTVNYAPSISIQPGSQTVNAGQTVSFGVVATGTATLAYQWTKGGVNISGATSSTYTTPVTSFADNGAVYAVVVSNSAGTATSNNATLTVNLCAHPSAPSQRQPNRSIAGQTVSFWRELQRALGNYYLPVDQGTAVNISGATSQQLHHACHQSVPTTARSMR